MISESNIISIYRESVRTVIAFYKSTNKRRWLQIDVDKTAGTHISFVRDSKEENTGYDQWAATAIESNGRISIELSRMLTDQPLDKIAEVLAHEIVHVMQYTLGERFDEEVAYYDRPMEKEAYRLQEEGKGEVKSSSRTYAEIEKNMKRETSEPSDAPSDEDMKTTTHF